MRRAAAPLAILAIFATLLLWRVPILRHPRLLWSILGRPSPTGLPIPVAGGRPRDLRDTWGAAREGGRRHQGIDIFARRGTAIVSATDGIVVTVGTNRLGGRIVRVLGPGRMWHYYAHLEAFAPIREGAVVRRGTVLGTVGDSGNARGTPPHLHYGIYRFAGGAINPYPLLTR